MFELPTSIKIDDEELLIRNNGDFRMVLDCFSALNDEELENDKRVITSLIIFYEGINSIEDVFNLPNIEQAVEEMFNFFNCGKKETGYNTKVKLIDWEKDEMLIASAVNNVANKEVRQEPYLHWWTFMGYYLAVGESVLSTVVSIRNKITKGKKLEKWEQEFKRDNPNYFIWDKKTEEDREAEEWGMSMWNGEGGN